MTNPDRAFQKHAHLFGSATYASPTTAWSVSRFGDRSVVFSGVNSLLVLVFPQRRAGGRSSCGGHTKSQLL